MEEARIARGICILYFVVTLCFIVSSLPLAQIQEFVRILSNKQQLAQDIDRIEPRLVGLYVFSLIAAVLLFNPCIAAWKANFALSCKADAWERSFPAQVDEIKAIVAKFKFDNLRL